jgi:hypothetical protein
VEYLEGANSMIHAAGDLGVYINLGSNEPGMTPQREYRDGRYLVWRDYEVDGETVKAPVDIDALPAGRYRMV